MYIQYILFDQISEISETFLLIHSDFMRSLISKMDFRSLEMKLYKAKVCFLSIMMIFIIKN